MENTSLNSFSFFLFFKERNEVKSLTKIFILSLQNVLVRNAYLHTNYSISSKIVVQRTKSMLETTCVKQLTDRQTQFGNARKLDLSECIFVFKGSQSDYEEPLSDEEVSRVRCYVSYISAV